MGRGIKRCLAWVQSLYTLNVERRRKAKKKEEAEPAPVVEPPVITELPVVPLPEPEPEQTAFSFMEPLGDFTPPPLEFLNQPLGAAAPDPEALEMNSRILTKKLSDFGVSGRVAEVLAGPVVTMYEFEPAAGVKISRVASLQDDLALALRAAGVRVVAPIPGKGVIGIEIPNADREIVVLREVLQSEAFSDSRSLLTVALGKDTLGRPVITDLSRMPHLLIAGATGTGKSVCINSILMSLLYNASPHELRLLLIDPKRIELNIYDSIPHLLHPVVVDAAKATSALRWAVEEMQRRYDLLARVGARNIAGYNALLAKARKKKKKGAEEPPLDEDLTPLPYIVVAVDELSDLMIVASREVEEHITRLAQMARAAGIHLVVATQRPSVDVITGLIKANIPARISFKVSSRVDSRTVLDSSGAETLLGAGDMLFLPPGTSKLVRIHGSLVTESEVRKVVEHIRNQGGPAYELTLDVRRHEETAMDEPPDEMYDDAVRLVMEMGQASISMVQRRLRVGYNRAARMIERMEQDGIVGPSDGVKPREVLGPKGDS
jgi:S-DNA-T family DNA segregation ATPase FtsK/SpoIIIE